MLTAAPISKPHNKRRWPCVHWPARGLLFSSQSALSARGCWPFRFWQAPLRMPSPKPKSGVGVWNPGPIWGKRFYAVVAVSMLLGLALDFVGFNAVRMLFYAAVLNGVLAPPLIVLVTLLTSNPKVMGMRVIRL